MHGNDGFTCFLSDEELPLVHGTREFARDVLLPLDRACDRTEQSVVEHLDPVAEMGLLSLVLPESLGGLACSQTAYAAIIHELAYAAPSVAVTVGVHNMVGKMILNSGVESLSERLLPGWGALDHLGAFAISEADAGSDPSGVMTTAVVKDDHWIINGSKMWITNGLHGRWFVVLAQTGQVGDKATLQMILVDGNQDGFDRLKIEGKMGIRGSETVSLHLHDVTAPFEHTIGESGTGLRQALVALQGGRIGIAAQATGIAEACLDQMVAYAWQRHQFGEPIARKQAIQHMVADSLLELQASKALIYRACTSPHPAAAAQAKLYASEAACRIADRAVQVHGGTGFVNDSRVEQLYRDVRVTRIYEGTSEIQRLLIGRDLLANGVGQD